MVFVNRASAGCLVGKSIDGHKEFMRWLKSDRRYKASNAYIFCTAVIPGDKL
jgi:hypothetical protein